MSPPDFDVASRESPVRSRLARYGSYLAAGGSQLRRRLVGPAPVRNRQLAVAGACRRHHQHRQRDSARGGRAPQRARGALTVRASRAERGPRAAAYARGQHAESRCPNPAGWRLIQPRPGAARVVDAAAKPNKAGPSTDLSVPFCKQELTGSIPVGSISERAKSDSNQPSFIETTSTRPSAGPADCCFAMAEDAPAEPPPTLSRFVLCAGHT